MSPTLLYRIAALLLVLFAAGHTLGFLKFKGTTPEAMEVRQAMDKIHFDVRGTSLSFGGFYVGFGLYVTVYLLFSAFLAWYLGGLAGRMPQAIGALGWVFFAVQVASFVLSWIYFSAAPALLSGLVAALAGWAALLTRQGS